MCSFMTLQHPSSQYYVQNILEEYQNYDWFFMACEPETLFWDKLYIERVDVGGGLSTSQWPLGKVQNAVSVWWRRQKTNMLSSVHIFEMGTGKRKTSGIQGKKGKGCISQYPILITTC